METWQKCPVCNGTGIVFGQYTSNATCGTCSGHGIISILTGFPPEGRKDFIGTTTTGDTIFNPQDIPAEIQKIINENFNELL